jgi:hypothetical protein
LYPAEANWSQGLQPLGLVRQSSFYLPSIMRLFSFATCLALVFLSVAGAVEVTTEVEQWGTCEVTLQGPAEGNPFIDVLLTARFFQDETSIEVDGFYDGGGVYRLRFLPEKQGAWQFVTKSNKPELDGQKGEFEVTAPKGNNHGPVRVANTFHFAYADGIPYKQVGTTCYVWNHQPAELQAKTLETLATAPFNKLRFCVFPKRYRWNENEPELYPFEGTPPRTWDTERFNPKFFQHLDKCVLDLQKLGIEADIILLHPYDDGHWGFDRMTPVEDDRYLKYVVSRLAAYRNVWWSLANEYDFMDKKREEDWERVGQLVAAADPFEHLLSIHNGKRLFNQTRPWLTHASIQNGAAVEEPARAELFRDPYRKPIVFDEVKYEGDIPKRWGNISAEEMVHRFWAGTIAGTYVGHGETYLSDDDVLWWSKGGVLKGESPQRLAFLREVLEDSPAEGINPIDKWQNPEYAGKSAEYYLIYFGKEKPTEWQFKLPNPPQLEGLPPGEEMKFTAEVLDAWDMTVTPVEGTFTLKKLDDYFYGDAQGRKIELPGKPYQVIRINRVRE